MLRRRTAAAAARQSVKTSRAEVMEQLVGCFLLSESESIRTLHSASMTDDDDNNNNNEDDMSTEAQRSYSLESPLSVSERVCV